MERSNTDLTLANVSTNATTLFLNVTNSGSSTVHVSTVQILLNGTLVTAAVAVAKVDGNNATDLWGPGQVLYFEVQVSATGGERVAVTARGVAAYGVV